MFRNTPESFGAVAKALHWVVAALIFILLSVGFIMTAMDFSPAKIQIYGLHKSFGILVLVAVVLRAAWRFGNPKVRDLETHMAWEKILAKIAHTLLYIAMFAMPMTGWLMSSAGDFPATFFGLFDLPPLVAKDEALFEVFRVAHTVIAFVIIVVVGLHVAGALKHHFVDRDRTLKRMTTNGLGLAGGAVLALVAGALLALPFGLGTKKYLLDVQSAGEQEQVQVVAEGADKSAHLHQWVIKPESSSIAFEVTQSGEAFAGKFDTFTATIVFDPEHLETAKALVSIDIASINTGSADRDNQARGAEWFNSNQHPQAVFETESFTRTGANQYVAKGHLAIRGVKLPVELPFTLDIAGDAQGKTAKMQAELTLNRLDFGIGQGQWQSAETMGNPVKITLRVEAWQNSAWAQ